MFERFRIKTALRRQVIGLRGSVDPEGLRNAEDLFYEPAFVVAEDMKRNRWTSNQAMVFMVTDVLVQVDAVGNLAPLASEDVVSYAALRTLHDHVVAFAAADAALTPRISRPVDGRASPFDRPPSE